MVKSGFKAKTSWVRPRPIGKQTAVGKDASAVAACARVRQAHELQKEASAKAVARGDYLLRPDFAAIEAEVAELETA